ncbi:hypothetical protein EYC80_006188 [Monilinia laxa]|uniref:Uncharacterized protein n=1 Tax=Monilinia laxa TaxID=61186 RepID=A0A5N6KGF2_MONLA|nr:hypothetical protein EYC80_006188 [Monilinia laxa]
MLDLIEITSQLILLDPALILLFIGILVSLFLHYLELIIHHHFWRVPNIGYNTSSQVSDGVWVRAPFFLLFSHFPLCLELGRERDGYIFIVYTRNLLENLGRVDTFLF